MLKRRGIAAVVVCLGLACVALGIGGKRGAVADESPAVEGAKPPAGAAAPREEPLAASQEMISRRYKRFEDTLYKIAESMRKTDPERSDLLIRAIGKSKEDRIGQQMVELIALLRDNKQLGDAIERQGDVVTQLHSLLDLLLSEDRQKELKEEQARIKKYLEELNKIIARQKGNRADNERGAPAEDVAGQQKKIAEQTGKLGKSIESDDAAKQAKAGKSGSGKPKPGDAKPGEGEPKDGDDKDPKPADGKPGEGKPDEKDPKEAKPGEGKPGEPKEGDPKDAKPGEGEPKAGKPGEGDPKPTDGQPNEGKPGEGQDSKPQEGQPQEGQPSEGQPSDGKPAESQQTPGRDELEKAKRAMEQAIEKLKKAKRHEASDEQDEAISNLQKAKEKLEEILRQLREEERSRFLAMLEARFQRMLAMQLLVYDGTLKLAKTPDDDRSSRHSTRALQLARQEDEIAIEATKAITLLREEGTAVAFPEAVEQVRDDMRIVGVRLERTDVGELTQSIEREIIDALEEMIEALQKEMEKSKEKKEPPKPQDGQPQDPPLVDQLAELKMLRTLQLRVNHRTKRLGRMIEGEQAVEDDLVGQLQNLSERQARIQKATHDIATGRNK
jgi:hypothetical protein